MYMLQPIEKMEEGYDRKIYMACGFIWAWHDRNWDRHMTVKRLLKQTPMVQPAVRELDVDKICQNARFAYNIV